MLQLNFNPFPEINTSRLHLRRITSDDRADMFALRSNILAMKHISKTIPVEMSEIDSLIQKMQNGIETNTAIGWGVCIKGQNTVIGSVGFHRIVPEHYRAEIGYMLLPEYWRLGFMSEIMPEMVNYAFNTMKIHSVEANIDPTNEKSSRLLKKFGFRKEAYFRENYYYDGKFLDSEIYSLLQSWYLNGNLRA
jgi:ribosomal-protein-alanine N-acetyltransferase